MADSPELAALLSEYTALDAAAEPQRAKEILSRAAPLVDRAESPKKWAALRSAFANLAERDDPPAAIAAYRDALTVWQREEDPATWSYSQMQAWQFAGDEFLPPAVRRAKKRSFIWKPPSRTNRISPDCSRPCMGFARSAIPRRIGVSG